MNISGLLRHNLQLKLLSLFLAIIIWLFVYLEGEDRLLIPAEIEFAGLANGLSVVRPDKFVKVEVEGARVLLIRQSIQGVSMKVDLSDSAVGTNLQKLDYGGIRVLKGLKVIDMMPKNIRLEIK